MDLYREEILDHYKNPRNFGSVEKFKNKAMDRNASCGDVIEMGLVIEKGKIKEIKFSGVGCAVAMASTSMLTEMIKGKTLAQAKRITEKDMIKKLGINISLGRRKCATLGLIVFKKMLV